MDDLLHWCTSQLGSCQIVSDDSREHPEQQVKSLRLQTPQGRCFLKTHRSRQFWESEVYAYEHWAHAFGVFAPRLLAVRDEEPRAIVISELPGRVLEGLQLPRSQEQAIWRASGHALANLHSLEPGPFFGPCLRDGTPARTPVYNAIEYVSRNLDEWTGRGLKINCLSVDELSIVRDVRSLLPAFAGERPTPCHRDYCPANWLVTVDGAWTGVIDFEFSHWDVRVADFTRSAFWEWVNRPDLMDALYEGYGRCLTDCESQQILVGHAQYALAAIVWGEEVGYRIYAAEGRDALKRVGEML